MKPYMVIDLEELKAENERLKAEGERLRAENQRLIEGGASWAKNAETFRAERGRLEAECAAALAVLGRIQLSGTAILVKGGGWTSANLTQTVDGESVVAALQIWLNDRAALSSNAGRELLERVERLEKACTWARDMLADARAKAVQGVLLRWVEHDDALLAELRAALDPKGGGSNG